MSSRGVVAAGHPRTAAAGAQVLREGGNAVDAAVAAMLMSFVTEPLLTGLGAGGYLLAAGFDAEHALLDFFVAAPGVGADPGRVAAELLPVEVSFGDATQVFNVGAASVGAWGTPAGACEAMRRWGSATIADVAAPAVRLAREGVTLNDQQGYVSEILEPILISTPEAAALFGAGGRSLRAGERFRWGDLALALERLGDEGAAPFYSGDIAAAVLARLQELGGVLTAEDLDAYEAVAREPVDVAYRGRRVVTNPPPSAGGTLIALALALLDQATGPPEVGRVVDVMEQVQAGRTPAFVDGLDEPGFATRFLASRLGATTHISVLDGEGRACAVTCTNGEGCGIVVPGTGMHPNNIMGEEDLNPLGFGAFAPQRRMPSMMAPTIVVGDAGVELVLGSAGSNRIRSAILQTIVGVVDRGLGAQAAVFAPRAHVDDGVVYVEPGIDADALRAAGHTVTAFGTRNLFFGGVQAVERNAATGAVSGAGDPRRGGVAAAA